MKNLFLFSLLGFTPYWHYKPTNTIHADSPGYYNSDKILNSSTIDKIDWKCDAIDSLVVNGNCLPILFSSILDKPAGYKVLCQFETFQ